MGEEVKAIIRNTGRAGARRAHAREGVQKLFFDDRNTNDCRGANKAEKKETEEENKSRKSAKEESEDAPKEA